MGEFPSRFVVVDIETVRDASLPMPKKPDECSPPPWHEVVCLGWMTLDLADPNATECGAIVGDPSDKVPERGLLQRFANGMNRELRGGAKPRTLLTFGGRRFDVPVIVARCMKHGIAWPWYWSRFGARVRYKAEGHIDLCDELSEYGAATYSGLDTWARLVGLEGKSGSGADVETMIGAGRILDVARYCLDDVRLTAALFLRWLVVRGTITSDEEEPHRASVLAARPRERRLQSAAA